MKKIFLLCVVTVCFLSCEKDKEDSNKYFIKATINGTEINYTKNARASISYGDFTNSLFMYAIDETGALSPAGFELRITQNNKPFQTGTFIQTANNGLHYIDGVYNPGGDDLYYIYKAGANPNAKPPFTITINSTTGLTVSGTFSGEYYHNYPNDSLHFSDSVLITKGAFKLPIK